VVYSACEDLGNWFGFQDNSVRNQAEHVLILISNHCRNLKVNSSGYTAAPSPVHSLHDKIFENYSSWCTTLGIKPAFT